MIKNRNAAIILLVLVIFTFHLKDVVAKDLVLRELVEITDAFEAEALQVKTWQIMIREQIDKKEMPDMMQAISQIGFSSSYTTETSKKAIKYKWNSQIEDSSIESIIMVTSKRHNTVDVIYKIESVEAGNLDQHYIEDRIHLLLENVFSEDMTKFTCVSTEVDAIINSDNLFDRMIERLDVKEIDEIDETDFIVMSGFTGKWEAAMPSLNNSMNIQLAARKGLNGKLNFTIGTPILTTEY